MFYWNQKELLNVVSHRCKELAAWRWAVTTVKSRNEGSGSMEGNVHFFSWKMDRSAAHWWWPQGLPQSTPHLQQVTLTGPWLSHPIPQGPRGAGWQLLHQALLYRASATNSTGSLWVWLLCITLGTSSLVCFSMLLKKTWMFWRIWKEEMWSGCWEVYVWILEMSQSTLTMTWWPETTTTCPYKDIYFYRKLYFYWSCLSNHFQGWT